MSSVGVSCESNSIGPHTLGLSVCFAAVSGYVSRVTASGVAGSAGQRVSRGRNVSEGERAERADTLLIAVVGNGGPPTP